MLRVTPIGSCRIAGPLQRAQDRLGIATHKGRVYGYCHSSGEAVQMARFLQGNFVPTLATWPLISRGTDLATLAKQTHDPADLYVIELSSSKRLTIDGVFVQLNYVTNAFAHFFADENRARAFWIRAEDGNQAAIDRFLAKQPVSDADRTLLRLLRLSLTTPEELRADIATLQALLGRILIVTHANARKPDGLPIATRSSFIDMVKDAARAVGVRVYDPTQRMLEMGQRTALADYSAGLAHYSDVFADALADDWRDLAIVPAIDDLLRQSGDDSVPKVLMPHVQALIGDVPFADLKARLAALSRDGLEVNLPYAKVEAAEDTFDAGSNPIHAAYVLGDFDALAAALAQAKVMPSTNRLLDYAKAAPTASAREILQFGFAANPDSDVLADHLAHALLEHPDPTFPEPLRAQLFGQIAPLQQIAICTAHGWSHAFMANALSPDDAADVTGYIALHQGQEAALTFLESWVSDESLPPQLTALLATWCTCHDLDRVAIVQLCRRVLTIDPQNPGARIALRDIRRNLRADMRAMSKVNDAAGLDGLAQINALLPDPLPEIDVFRARACFQVQDFDGAIKLGCRAAEALPDSLSIWVLLMRAAHKSQQQTLSARYAEKVIALSTVDTARFAQEAAKRIGDTTLVSHG